MKVVPDDSLAKELIEVFVSADIPLHKSKHPELEEFFNKHTTGRVPYEKTARQKYVPIIYNQTVESIRETIGNNYIWITVDETTDTDARCIVNIISFLRNL